MIAGAAKVLLLTMVLGAAISLAMDPSADLSHTDSLLWSALLYSRDPGHHMDMFSRRDFNPLLDLDPVGLVEYWGYPAERHWVTTEDGYVLGIHRIVGGRGEGHSSSSARAAAGRPVVILAHPLLSSSAEWIVTGPGRALALLLADEGYDVWMFNARGNTYSQNHTELSDKDAAFWDFSYHEHAVYDMPALIDYVIRETGEQKMQYVGFSMGSTIMFAMASLRPDVARHITLFTALGPATTLTHSRSRTFRALAYTSPALMTVAGMFHIRRFLPSTAAIRAAGEMFCSDGKFSQPLCVTLIGALSGRNDAQTNRTLLPYIISRTPSGTSFKTINHFAQSMKSGFQQYDYGKRENLKRYGFGVPPKYNVSNVFIPTRIHYGMNDHLADFKDVKVVCAQLPHLVSCDAVPDPLWTHLDFVWAKDVPSILYRRIIADMKSNVVV